MSVGGPSGLRTCTLTSINVLPPTLYPIPYTLYPVLYTLYPIPIPYTERLADYLID